MLGPYLLCFGFAAALILLAMLMTLGLSWMQVYGSQATGAAVAAVAGGAAAAVFLALWRAVLVRTPQGLYLLIVFAVGLFLVFIWPTPFEYHVEPRQGSFIVIQVHRITGETSRVGPP